MSIPRSTSDTLKTSAPDQPASGPGPVDDPEVQLSAMVPRSVRRAVRLYAEQQGVTVRTVLLGLIREAGIIDIPDAQLVDRRSTVGSPREGPSSMHGGDPRS